MVGILADRPRRTCRKTLLSILERRVRLVTLSLKLLSVTLGFQTGPGTLFFQSLPLAPWIPAAASSLPSPFNAASLPSVFPKRFKSLLREQGNSDPEDRCGGQGLTLCPTLPLINNHKMLGYLIIHLSLIYFNPEKKTMCLPIY